MEQRDKICFILFIVIILNVVVLGQVKKYPRCSDCTIEGFCDGKCLSSKQCLDGPSSPLKTFNWCAIEPGKLYCNRQQKPSPFGRKIGHCCNSTIHDKTGYNTIERDVRSNIYNLIKSYIDEHNYNITMFDLVKYGMYCSSLDNNINFKYKKHGLVFFECGGTSGVHSFACSLNPCDITTYQGASNEKYCDDIRQGVKIGNVIGEPVECDESIIERCSDICSKVGTMPGTCWSNTMCLKNCCIKDGDIKKMEFYLYIHKFEDHYNLINNRKNCEMMMAKEIIINTCFTDVAWKITPEYKIKSSFQMMHY